MTDSTTSDDNALGGQPSTSVMIERGDVVIAVVLVVTFTAAFITAWQWEAIAAYFPLTATGLGIVLCSIFLARCIVLLRKRNSSVPLRTDDASYDQAGSEHAFFASVGLSDWLISLAFFAAFFVALYVLGLYPTAIVFTVVYLRFQAKSSWLFSIVYAAVLTGALYALFEMALKLPVPAGLVGLS
jgi:hypothetical protein